MKKCVIVPDSFKGTLKATEICSISEDIMNEVFPDCQVISIPVADGGEGTVDAFAHLPGWEKCFVKTTGPYGEQVNAYFAKKGKCAVVETAMAAGLPMVAGRENPAVTSTYGVGIMIQAALDDGCSDMILGLGGSCTNDCGAGMAAALGVTFCDSSGKSFVPTGDTLHEVAYIDVSLARKKFEGCKLRAMCDVTNPLFGSSGAAYTFAPQKGADEIMTKRLDQNLRHFSSIIEKCCGKDVSQVPGAGAAGGMGAAVVALLGGTLQSGIETVLDVTSFDEEIQGADLVITGEGKVDRQSLDGKAISGIAAHAVKKNVPVVVMAGAIEKGIEKDLYGMGIRSVFSINRRPEELSISGVDAADNYRLTLESILRFLKNDEVK